VECGGWGLQTIEDQIMILQRKLVIRLEWGEQASWMKILRNKYQQWKYRWADSRLWRSLCKQMSIMEELEEWDLNKGSISYWHSKVAGKAIPSQILRWLAIKK